MKNLWRKLDNTAKVFSLDEQKNTNTFRLSAILKEEINPIILKEALIKALEMYPSYKVKIRSGFFWNYLEINKKDPIIEEEKEMPCKSINFGKNNDYVFKVTYFNKKINLDIFHILTDGLGATVFLKSILYNYLNLKYNLKTNDKEMVKDICSVQDQYLKSVDRKIIYREKLKEPFIIKGKSNLKYNKTYHYILNLEEFKKICKKKNVSITEYLTALYMYAIYRSIYNKSSNKEIIVAIPIDLRKYYNIETLFNFFTCMYIEGNIKDNKCITFDKILNQIHKEFKNKLTVDNIKSYLSRDVNLGTNLGIRLVPLVVKKIFMKYCGEAISQIATTTLSNIGSVEIEKQYRKYVDNVIALVSSGRVQKAKCTICSYENNLTVTLNSNLLSDNLEKEFYKLLIKHVKKVKVESNNN